MIERLEVPKIKSMLPQHEELIEFREPEGEMLIVLYPRSMVMCGVSLRLALEQDLGDSAVKLNPVLV